MNIAVAVVEWNGAYLVGTRGAAGSLAGYAEFPGGKIEPGESTAHAAARECCEETGLDVTVVRELRRVRYDYPHGQVEIAFLLCRPCEPQAPLLGSFHWVKREELAAHRFPPANEEMLRELVGGRLEAGG